MGGWRDRGADLADMRLHRRRVAVIGHDETSALALFRADRVEDVGPLGALVVGRPGPGAATSLAAGDLVFCPTHATSCHHSSMGVPAVRRALDSGSAIEISEWLAARLLSLKVSVRAKNGHDGAGRRGLVLKVDNVWCAALRHVDHAPEGCGEKQ